MITLLEKKELQKSNNKLNKRIEHLENQIKNVKNLIKKHNDLIKEYDYFSVKNYFFIERIEGEGSVDSPIVTSTYLQITDSGKYRFNFRDDNKTLFYDTEENIYKIIKKIEEDYKSDYKIEEYNLNHFDNRYTKRFEYHNPLESYIKNYNKKCLSYLDFLNLKEENKLKTCPFCGSKARLYEIDSDNSKDIRYIVECSDRECNSMYKTKEEAIEHWNRRV